MQYLILYLYYICAIINSMHCVQIRNLLYFSACQIKVFTEHHAHMVIYWRSWLVQYIMSIWLYIANADWPNTSCPYGDILHIMISPTHDVHMLILCRCWLVQHIMFVIIAFNPCYAQAHAGLHINPIIEWYLCKQTIKLSNINRYPLGWDAKDYGRK